MTDVRLAERPWTLHDQGMTSVRRPPERSQPRSPTAAGGDDFRRMVLLLETADVLERRARRTSDPTQVAVLLRRAEQRRRQADGLRERLVARGAALGPQQSTSVMAARRPRLLQSSPRGGARESG